MVAKKQAGHHQVAGFATTEGRMKASTTFGPAPEGLAPHSIREALEQPWQRQGQVVSNRPTSEVSGSLEDDLQLRTKD